MTPPSRIEVLDDPAAALAALLVEAATAGAHIALTGGSTPAAAYERAARGGADWSSTGLWWSDERCVAPDDPRSNHAMARTALLDRVAGSPSVHRIQGELGPAPAADAYERELHDCFGAGMPELDLVLLGLGADGHCASLFPDQPAVLESERIVVGVPEAGLEPYVPRVSFTLPLINAAARVAFLVTGEQKADAVARAFAADPDPATPASMVAPTSGDLVLLCDGPAAARLESGEAA